MNTATADRTATDAQTQVRRRLEEIWPTAAARDFERLESFHLYGPKFTEFKDGRPRGDAATCAAGERATFTHVADPVVEMRDLAINVYGDVAIATFNGHFTGRMAGDAVALEQQVTLVFALVDDDWKIVHEHMSPMSGAMPGAGGPPQGAGGPPRS